MKVRSVRIHDLTFWHYQITGWIIFFTSQIFLANIESGTPPWWYILAVSESAVGFLLTVLLRTYYKNIRIQDIRIFSIIPRIAVCSLLFALIWLFGNMTMMWALRGNSYLVKTLTYQWISQAVAYLFPIPFGWSALYFGIKFWRKLEEEKAETEKASALAQQAQLQMLRYQLNPHFLFNTLNSVRALIDEDLGVARVMITELSEFLRYSLACRNQIEVMLKDELNAVRNYLSIEKKRYEDKLDVSYEIDPKTETYPIASFSIQPLIEQVVKHGMQTSTMPLKLKIEIVKPYLKLQITIVNTGRLLQPNNGHNSLREMDHVIENVKIRLEKNFPGKYEFNLYERDSHMYLVIEIN
jgi:two-component system, LytTR family, sensor kinase